MSEPSAASGYEFSFQVFEVTAEEADTLFDATASFVHERADQVFGIGPGPIKDEGTSPSDAADIDWVEVFWELVRDSRASDDDPYLDDTMQRLLARAIGRPGCVAWIKVSGFNRIEAYVYDVTKTKEGYKSPVLPLLAKVGYTKLSRPRDPSDIDWIVEFTPRG